MDMTSKFRGKFGCKGSCLVKVVPKHSQDASEGKVCFINRITRVIRPISTRTRQCKRFPASNAKNNSVGERLRVRWLIASARTKYHNVLRMRRRHCNMFMKAITVSHRAPSLFHGSETILCVIKGAHMVSQSVGNLRRIVRKVEADGLQVSVDLCYINIYTSK